MSVVEHVGQIVRIEGGRCFVRIEQLSACAACQVRSSCTASDKKDKIVEARATAEHYEEGEFVRLLGQQSLGLKAVFYAYLLPLMLLCAMLCIMLFSGVEEALAGAVSLLSVAIYYGILYFLKDRFKKKFTFELTKLKKEL